jgi:peptidylprolyl isomerase
MIDDAKVRVQQAEEMKKSEEEKTIGGNWPQAKVAANGVKYVIVRTGEGEALASGTRLKIVYTGRTLGGQGFVSTADGGKPYFGEVPEPFEFEVGRAQVQIGRGFDSIVAQMKKGEKRTLIVPAGQAYGTAGFYDRERPGHSRFHISPGTTLVYEVEVQDIISK